MERNKKVNGRVTRCCHFSVRPSLGQDLAYTTNKMVIRKIAEESTKREIESEKAKERGKQPYNSYK